jgi:hypothetical protein
MSRIKLREAGVLSRETELRTANEHTAHSSFSRERWEVFSIRQLCACKDDADRSTDRPIFFDRQMRTASLVVFEIILKDAAQTSLMENNDVVQTLPQSAKTRQIERSK